MRRFHLIGQNIQTSLSPTIHNFLFQLKGFSHKNYHYSLYHQENTSLTLEDMRKSDIAGLSITIPFKQAYKRYLSEGRMYVGTVRVEESEERYWKGSLDPVRQSAEDILASRYIINTMKRSANPDGRNVCDSFTSFNTDIFGIKMCFGHNSPIPPYFLTTHRKKMIAVVIGGGATAEVFMSYFQQLGIEMVVLNRSVDKVTQLKQKFYPNIVHISGLGVKEQTEVRNIRQKNFSQAVIINTLPTKVLRENLIISPASTVNPLESVLKNTSIKSVFFMDVNYRDKQQTLIKLIVESLATKKNQIEVKEVSSGLDMLIWQAVMQNHIFCLESAPMDLKINVQQLENLVSQYSEVVKILRKMAEIQG